MAKKGRQRGAATLEPKFHMKHSVLHAYKMTDSNTAWYRASIVKITKTRAGYKQTIEPDRRVFRDATP